MRAIAIAVSFDSTAKRKKYSQRLSPKVFDFTNRSVLHNERIEKKCQHFIPLFTLATTSVCTGCEIKSSVIKNGMIRFFPSNTVRRNRNNTAAVIA